MRECPLSTQLPAFLCVHLISHTIYSRDQLSANPSEHPLMLAEPSFNTKDIREKTIELLFEKFSPPALFLAKNAVLSSFAMGRQSSLVVDAGHEGIVGERRAPLHFNTGSLPLPVQAMHACPKGCSGLICGWFWCSVGSA